MWEEGGYGKVHIVYVTPEFVTECKGGGLATYIANISRILVEHGHTVTVVTASDTNNDSIIWHPGIQVKRVKNSGKFLIVPLYKLWKSWILCRQVRKINKKNPIDLVQYASFESVGFFRIKRIPSVVRISSECVSLRAYKVIDYCQEDLNKLCLTDKIEYCAIKRIENIYGPSYATAQIVGKRIKKDISIIESPFYLNNEEYDYSIFNDKLKGKKYLLSHSSMSCLKGTHIIAQVISEVCKQDENIYFVFAGNDHGIFYRDGRREDAKEYITRLAGEYADRVIFLGTLSRQELYPIVENSYACLMPSRIDNMPNTCIEAMAMGKIVIGTRGASYDQFIENGISGYLIDIDDAEGLFGAIVEINRLNEETREQMCKEAMKITRRFEPENIYQKVVEYYTEVIKKGRKIW